MWTKAPSSWYWVVNSPTSANLIKYVPINGQGGTLGLTTKWLDASNNTIIEMEIKFDSAENWNIGHGGPDDDEIDLRSVAAREFGHALGLKHTQAIPHLLRQ
jgi:hypothetical protein